VSVDAMEEFRIQTSTFAPEFGRTPGGQISIVTRSGTNRFHGTLFEYLRNDLFDAANWFNGYTNNPPLPKAEERQNDFGGTVGGPIAKDRTFFFFSYEGLRLRLPQTAITEVPDLAARQAATPAMQPYLNAFPKPNGADDPATGIAGFNATYSNPATIDAYSLRIDHKLNHRWSLFGRYNYSPSNVETRGSSGISQALSVVQPFSITTLTATGGATTVVAPTMINDFRLNYSRTEAESSQTMDSFGGAVPLQMLPLPSGFGSENSLFEISITSLGQGNTISEGRNVRNVQRQWNLVDSLTWQKGSHGLKAGVDFRQLDPTSSPFTYLQAATFGDVGDSELGNIEYGFIESEKVVPLRFRNLGLFVQDSWRVFPRLTFTYGLRWDVDVAPKSLNGPAIPAVTGYSLTDLANLAIAPVGTPAFHTPYGGLAPRFGAAYQFGGTPNRQTVLRGGFGVFYDLVSAETGNAIGLLVPPFGNTTYLSSTTFPYSAAEAAPPPIAPQASISNLNVFNPNLKLPYTLEWNVSVEQALGNDQTLSVSYLGASGRRLLQTTIFLGPPSNPAINEAAFVDNTGSSDYDALQVQFQRRLSHGLQALASYTFSHSIDDGSASSGGSLSNLGPPGAPNQNRGDSAFDIRHAFSAGVTYNLPTPKGNRLAEAIGGNWSTENIILARSAPPVDITDANFYEFNDGIYTNIRPDVVPGVPWYLYGSQYPGGKAINPGAFSNPPSDPVTGNPTRQGSLGRDALRGFGATEWDFAIHRDFPIGELLKLQFRAEMFNVLNHPNFGPPNNAFGGANFGIATEMLGSSLSGGNLSGGLNPLYQIGGPRSVQFALKLFF
jgi:TonB dependent receptor